jgi:hypothetical protein
MRPSRLSWVHLPNPDQNINPQLDRWNAARERVRAREEYNLQTPTLEPLPQELQARGHAFLQRADVAASFVNWDVSVGMADLRKILSFQKVVTGEAVERVAKIDRRDPQALFSFCLPEPTEAIQLPMALDPQGFSVASANPNMRVLSGRGANIEGQTFFGFTIGFGSTFVQVVEYQGR